MNFLNATPLWLQKPLVGYKLDTTPYTYEKDMRWKLDLRSYQLFKKMTPKIMHKMIM